MIKDMFGFVGELMLFLLLALLMMVFVGLGIWLVANLLLGHIA